LRIAGDPRQHPKAWVCLIVAAEFLEMNVKSLDAYMAEGRIAWEWKGRRRKIHRDEVSRFDRWQREQRKAS